MNKLNKVTREKLKSNIARIKSLKSKACKKMTVSRLKQIKGFENISNEMAQKVIDSLTELSSVILLQMNRNQLKHKL